MKRTGIPSPAISGLAFKVIPGTHRSHPAIQAAIRSLDDGREGVERQREREGPIAADPTETGPFKAVLRAELSDKTIARIFPRIDQAHDGLVRAEKGLELATKQVLRSPDRSLDAEIRERIASMSEKGREAALADAVKDGDLQVIGAVVSGPPMLSGLSLERLELLRASYLRAHRPDLVGQAEALGPGETFPLPIELLEDPELSKPPEPVVPRLAWRRRATCLVGPDKGGKSTMAGHCVATVTRGGFLLGERVTVDRVLVVAPDEAVGDTVRRVKELDANPYRARVLTLRPPDPLGALDQILAEWPAGLVVVDSLSEWARLKEGRSPDDGDSAGWGSSATSTSP